MRFIDRIALTKRIGSPALSIFDTYSITNVFVDKIIIRSCSIYPNCHNAIVLIRIVKVKLAVTNVHVLGVLKENKRITPCAEYKSFGWRGKSQISDHGPVHVFAIKVPSCGKQCARYRAAAMNCGSVFAVNFYTGFKE